MTPVRRATAIDIITSTDGDIFIRFYDGDAIYAVAGLTRRVGRRSGAYGA